MKKKQNNGINIAVVTPMKNEEISLPYCYNSIINQTLKPKIWIIVDDGSTDTSPKLIKEYKKKHKLIHLIHLNGKKRDLGVHYAIVCIEGFNYLLKRDIPLDYIALIDADIILDKDYFKDIVNIFKKDKKLGICGGGIYIKDKRGNWKWENTFLDHVRGANRVWRFSCFTETEGFIPTYAPDGVSNAKARIKGWKIKQIPQIKSYQTRKTSEGEGLWKGYKNRGRTSYFLNHHPFHILLRFIKYGITWPFYPSIAYLSGWIEDIIKKKEKINDQEIKSYFNKKWKEALKQWKSP